MFPDGALGWGLSMPSVEEACPGSESALLENFNTDDPCASLPALLPPQCPLHRRSYRCHPPWTRPLCWTSCTHTRPRTAACGSYCCTAVPLPRTARYCIADCGHVRSGNGFTFLSQPALQPRHATPRCTQSPCAAHGFVMHPGRSIAHVPFGTHGTCAMGIILKQP